MTGKRQRARISEMAEALKLGIALHQSGELETVARLWEEQRTVSVEREQEVLMALSIAVKEFPHFGEEWGQ